MRKDQGQGHAETSGVLGMRLLAIPYQQEDHRYQGAVDNYELQGRHCLPPGVAFRAWLFQRIPKEQPCPETS